MTPNQRLPASLTPLDAALTALLDGELAETERTEIVRRLTAEPRLRERLQLLRYR